MYHRGRRRAGDETTKKKTILPSVVLSTLLPRLYTLLLRVELKLITINEAVERNRLRQH